MLDRPIPENEMLVATPRFSTNQFDVRITIGTAFIKHEKKPQSAERT